MKILVTGGCGFVGSHIVDRLLADGHSVFVVDDHSSGQRNHVDGASYLPPGFVECGRRVEQIEAVELEGVEAVVHAAAYPELRHNWDSPAQRHRLLAANVCATVSLLEAMPEVPIVYLSSASVYGSQPGVMCTEGMASAETCESPYAATKFAGELLVAAYAHKRGTPWHALRLVNVVGERSHRGVIADFERMIRENRHIHAADNGLQHKSWVHVQDVAGAVARCLRGNPHVPSGVYNVTSVECISWWDIVDEMGIPRSEVTFDNREVGAVGDPHDLHVSGGKLAPYFSPARPVRDGIRAALHYRKRAT